MKANRVTTEWSVRLELPGTGRFDPEHADELVEALAPYHAAIGLGGKVLDVTLTVKAPSAGKAIENAMKAVKRAVPRVQPERLIHAEVETMAMLAKRLRRPARPAFI